MRDAICNTFSMAKTSGKAQCAPYYKNTITYNTSVLSSFNVTHNNFYVEAINSERCTLDIYSYFYYYNVIIVNYSLLLLLLFLLLLLLLPLLLLSLLLLLLLYYYRMN